MWTVECKNCNSVMRQHARGMWWVGLSRDNLIRLVVGMQWAVACSLYDSRGNNGGWSTPGHRMDDFGGDWMQSVAEEVSTQTASTIVDEWLGVR